MASAKLAMAPPKPTTPDAASKPKNKVTPAQAALSSNQLIFLSSFVVQV